ncbi:MAG: hypothetical protein RDV48_26635 [Candidatus Eremiobacteraeota bacterium]|nr:hypothetical protein [Candidatus Eremiobacteraeota bacterium]
MDSISGISIYDDQPAIEDREITGTSLEGRGIAETGAPRSVSAPVETTADSVISTEDSTSISDEAQEERTRRSGQPGAGAKAADPGTNEIRPDMAAPASAPAEGKAPASKVGEAATADKKKEYYEKYAADLGGSIGGDGKRKPLNDEQKKILAEGLSRYDSSVLDKLKEMGIKFDIYDTKNPPPGGYPKGSILDDSGTWEDNKAGYYARDSKTVCLRQDSFEGGMKEDTLNTISHETAHGVDDLLEADQPSGGYMGNEMMSFKDETLKMLYAAYNQRCDTYENDASSQAGTGLAGIGGIQDGKGAVNESKNPNWSSYARTNESEYFAEGMMKYTAGKDSREAFKNADPDLYGFVEKKMDQAKDPMPEYKEPPPPPPPTPEQAKKFREMFSLPSEVSDALISGNVKEMKEIMSDFPDYLKQGSFGGIHPLYAAAIGEKPKEMLTFLVGQGLDVNAKCMGDKTVLELVREAGRKDVEEILKSLGAKDSKDAQSGAKDR